MPDSPRLDPLRRPSGAFAMLAVDQREALRVMMTEAIGADQPVSDEAVVEFKLTAARLLTPYASAVLIDRQFAFDRAGEFPVALKFHAGVKRAEGWNTVEFFAAPSALQRLVLRGVGADTQFRFEGAARPERVEHGNAWHDHRPGPGCRGA